MGKRARREANAKKQDAREQRRLARSQRRKDREAGLIEPGVPLGEPYDIDEDAPAPPPPPAG